MTNNIDDEFDEIILLQQKARLLARAIDYIRHYIAGHKIYDYPAARELILEYEEMEKRG